MKLTGLQNQEDVKTPRGSKRKRDDQLEMNFTIIIFLIILYIFSKQENLKRLFKQQCTLKTNLQERQHNFL